MHVTEHRIIQIQGKNGTISKKLHKSFILTRQWNRFAKIRLKQKCIFSWQFSALKHILYLYTYKKWIYIRFKAFTDSRHGTQNVSCQNFTIMYVICAKRETGTYYNEIDESFSIFTVDNKVKWISENDILHWLCTESILLFPGKVSMCPKWQSYRKPAFIISLISGCIGWLCAVIRHENTSKLFRLSPYDFLNALIAYYHFW